MPDEVISRGKTTEDAIAKALAELGATREEVEVLPLQSPTKGLFGLFGGKDAEVRVTLRNRKVSREAASAPKPPRQDRPARPERQPERQTDAPKGAARAAQSPPASPQSEQRPPRGGQPARNADRPAAQSPPQGRREGRDRREPRDNRDNRGEQDRSSGRPAASLAEIENYFRNAGPAAPVTALPTGEDNTEEGKILKEVAADVLHHMGLPGEVSVAGDDECLVVRIQGAGGILIGRRGQTLMALQYYLGRVIAGTSEEEQRKVIVDVDDYRIRREESLRSMAQDAAKEAIASGQEKALPPMEAHDRRIIHVTLQDAPGIETTSRGSGARKRVIVIPRNRRRQGNENRRRGGGGGNRRGSGRPRRVNRADSGRADSGREAPGREAPRENPSTGGESTGTDGS